MPGRRKSKNGFRWREKTKLKISKNDNQAKTFSEFFNQKSWQSKGS